MWKKSYSLLVCFKLQHTFMDQPVKHEALQDLNSLLAWFKYQYWASLCPLIHSGSARDATYGDLKDSGTLKVKHHACKWWRSITDKNTTKSKERSQQYWSTTERVKLCKNARTIKNTETLLQNAGLETNREHTK